MAVKSMGYDHPTYQARQAVGTMEAGGAATTAYAKFTGFTAMLAFSAQLTVTTAGTAAGHGFAVCKISGTSTTTYATSTLGTAVAGTTVNVLLNTAAAGGGQPLLQGDILEVVSLTDATGKAAVGYEVQVQPLANVTA